MVKKFLCYVTPTIRVKWVEEDICTASSFGKLTDENDDKALFESWWM